VAIRFRRINRRNSIFLQKYQNIKTIIEAIFIGPGSKGLLYQSILIFEGDFLIP
jgi:hypothetical protein